MELRLYSRGELSTQCCCKLEETDESWKTFWVFHQGHSATATCHGLTSTTHPHITYESQAEMKRAQTRSGFQELACRKDIWKQ